MRTTRSYFFVDPKSLLCRRNVSVRHPRGESADSFNYRLLRIPSVRTGTRERNIESGVCGGLTAPDLGWKVCSAIEVVVATSRAMQALPPTPCLLISLLVRDHIKELSLFSLVLEMIKVRMV
jgi:hypothetical protein